MHTGSTRSNDEPVEWHGENASPSRDYTPTRYGTDHNDDRAVGLPRVDDDGLSDPEPRHVRSHLLPQKRQRTAPHQQQLLQSTAPQPQALLSTAVAPRPRRSSHASSVTHSSTHAASTPTAMPLPTTSVEAALRNELSTLSHAFGMLEREHKLIDEKLTRKMQKNIALMSANESMERELLTLRNRTREMHAKTSRLEAKSKQKLEYERKLEAKLISLAQSEPHKKTQQLQRSLEQVGRERDSLTRLLLAGGLAGRAYISQLKSLLSSIGGTVRLPQLLQEAIDALLLRDDSSLDVERIVREGGLASELMRLRVESQVSQAERLQLQSELDAAYQQLSESRMALERAGIDPVDGDAIQPGLLPGEASETRLAPPPPAYTTLCQVLGLSIESTPQQVLECVERLRLAEEALQVQLNYSKAEGELVQRQVQRLTAELEAVRQRASGEDDIDGAGAVLDFRHIRSILTRLITQMHQNGRTSAASLDQLCTFLASIATRLWAEVSESDAGGACGDLIDIERSAGGVLHSMDRYLEGLTISSAHITVSDGLSESREIGSSVHLQQQLDGVECRLESSTQLLEEMQDLLVTMNRNAKSFKASSSPLRTSSSPLRASGSPLRASSSPLRSNASIVNQQQQPHRSQTVATTPTRLSWSGAGSSAHNSPLAPFSLSPHRGSQLSATSAGSATPTSSLSSPSVSLRQLNDEKVRSVRRATPPAALAKFGRSGGSLSPSSSSPSSDYSSPPPSQQLHHNHRHQSRHQHNHHEQQDTRELCNRHLDQARLEHDQVVDQLKLQHETDLFQLRQSLAAEQHQLLQDKES